MNLKKLILVSSLWIFVLGAILELSDQEAYYWMWSQKFDFCYFDHPPLQAWLTRIFTFLAGDAAWVIRLPATLSRLAIIFIFFIWCKERAGKKVAELAVYILLPTFFLCSGGLIALPDSLMLPFALLTVYFCEKKWVVAAGVALGLSALGKWTAALLVPGVIASIGWPLKTRWKQALTTLSISLLVQSPVLWWNYQHNFVSFLFHLKSRHETRHWGNFWFTAQNLMQFGASQFLLGGFSFFAVFYFARKFIFSKPAQKERPGLSSLAWWSLPFFTVFSLSAMRGEVRFYWAVFALFPCILFLARRLSFLELPILKRFMKVQGILLYLMLAIVSFIMLVPIGPLFKPLTEQFTPYNLRHSPRGDWKGWGEWVNQDLRPLNLVTPDRALLASNFRLTAQLAWALRENNFSRMGTVSRAQNQFSLWEHPTPDTFKKALFFGDNRYPVTSTFDSFCAHKPLWQKRSIFLMNKVIKEISWATCEQFILPQWAVESWKGAEPR